MKVKDDFLIPTSGETLVANAIFVNETNCHWEKDYGH